MDRPIVYVGELPRAEDFLGLAKDALYGFGYLAQATIGANTGVNGFQIAPTGPASLSFTIGTGSIYANETVDASAYGVLGTDSNTIFKQGISATPVTLTVTPPATSGFSQVYLVQVGYSDVDGGAIVPPYYNSANPAVPFNGAGGAGGSQNTIRQGQAVIQLKAGTAASTGSQTTPSADPGFTGLWAVTVANGATTVTSSNWVQLSLGQVSYGAPWFPSLESLATLFLPTIPTTTYYVATTGSDVTGTGTSANPWATVANAVSVISGFQSENAVTINVAAGTYVIPSGSDWCGIGSTQIAAWNIVGASSSTTIINATATGARGIASNTATVSVSGVSIGSYYEAYSSSGGGTLTVRNCKITGSSHLSGVVSYSGSLINVYGTINISGTFANSIFSAAQGEMNLGYHDVNIPTADSVTLAFGTTTCTAVVAASSGGLLQFDTSVTTFSGSTPTGSRYGASSFGTISVQGSGVNYIPGTSAGVAAGSTTITTAGGANAGFYG